MNVYVEPLDIIRAFLALPSARSKVGTYDYKYLLAWATEYAQQNRSCGVGDDPLLIADILAAAGIGNEEAIYQMNGTVYCRANHCPD